MSNPSCASKQETTYEDNKITSYKLTCFTLSIENRHSDILKD